MRVAVEPTTERSGFVSSAAPDGLRLVDAPNIRFAIDSGASSLIALNKLAIAHNTTDAIVLTHLHADRSRSLRRHSFPPGGCNAGSEAPKLAGDRRTVRYDNITTFP